MAEPEHASTLPVPHRVLRRAWSSLTWGIGAVAIVVALDLVVGSVWASKAPEPDPAASVPVDAIPLGLDREPLLLDDPLAPELPPDPREDAPALADAPWRHEYFQEMRRVGTTWWPYLLYLPFTATGRYINIVDGVRMSYEPAEAETAPVVDLYGGSALYGEGQRDDHTIGSELARLAEADGLPIVVRNRGVQGWVHWQEMLLFEQVSADPDRRPDLALFYDGANERPTQQSAISGVPTHPDQDDLAARTVASDGAADRIGPWADAAASPEPEQGLALAWSTYREHSALLRIGRALRSTLGSEPAGATPDDEPGTGTEGVPVGDNDETTAAVYARGRGLVQHLAAERDVVVHFFWQPVLDGGWSTYASEIDDPTVDLSQLLAVRDELFLDFVHTNEEGARLAAEAIWPHLRPSVEAWYDDHG